MDSQSALLSLAHVIRLVILPDTLQLNWDGFLDPIKESCENELPSDWNTFASFLDLNNNKLPADCSALDKGEFVFKKQSDWVFNFHCSDLSKNEIFINCVPKSDSTTASAFTHSLNSRLQLGMAEAHHRVKNTLQNVISYINVLMSGKNELMKDEVQKLTSYIHALSSLHDVLLEEVKSNGDGKTVGLDRVLNDVLEINAQNKSISWDEVPDFKTSPRKAATISLILNELLDNAAKHGQGTIEVKIKSMGDNLATLEVSNQISTQMQLSSIPNESQGLKVVRLLAKSDLQSELVIESSDSYLVKLTFSVH